jgi:hypothetical protein
MTTKGEMVTVDILGSLRRLLFDLATRLVVLVVVVLLIALAPLITLAFPAFAALGDHRIYIVLRFFDDAVREERGMNTVILGYGFAWLAFVCPFCVSIYYMFVASVTRYARAAHEGISPRTGIFWAASRQLGSMVVSYALVLVPAVAFIRHAESHRSAESALRNRLFVEKVEYVNIDGVVLPGDKWVSPSPLLYILYFAGTLLVWSPVLVNFARHSWRVFDSSAPVLHHYSGSSLDGQLCWSKHNSRRGMSRSAS